MLLVHPARAAELKVLSAGAIEPGLKTADVLIAPPALIEDFARDGRVAQLRAGVGRVGLGVAVRPGAPVPDISTAAALQRSVVEADSLTFNTASTGLYFEGLLKKMGIYESVLAKTTRYPDGASVMQHLLNGKGREVGFGPITEILQFRDKGLRLVGPLPAEVQNYTSYTAAPHSAAANADAAAAFVRFLASAAGKAYFTAAGIE